VGDEATGHEHTETAQTAGNERRETEQTTERGEEEIWTMGEGNAAEAANDAQAFSDESRAMDTLENLGADIQQLLNFINSAGILAAQALVARFPLSRPTSLGFVQQIPTVSDGLTVVQRERTVDAQDKKRAERMNEESSNAIGGPVRRGNKQKEFKRKGKKEGSGHEGTNEERKRERERRKEDTNEEGRDRRERIQETDECARIGAGKTKEGIGRTGKKKQGRARAKWKGERANRDERYGSGSSRRAEQTAGGRRSNNMIEKKE
jgi:hypothetical protein